MMEENASSEKTVVAVDAGATVLGATVACPVCKTENPPTEKYCGECGFLLSQELAGPVEIPEQAPQVRLVEAVGGREYYLKEGENSVGRESADVLISDFTVSRRHALIVVESGRVWLEDLGSTNGTYAGGGRRAFRRTRRAG